MITATLPPHNLNLFQARRASFQSHCSPLNPTTRPASCSAQTLTKRASPADSTQTHLSNLEKLLHSKDPPAPAPAPSPGSPESGKPARPGPLEGLNLAKLWPAVKAAAAEEVSPCHLKRLQRLLLMTPEYSPRNNLGGRWPEYHGSRDWAGLLDPLDENLRREVVRYGELVQAAYQSFHGDPALPPEAAPAERQVPLSHGSFKVTRSLYATSSVGLPGWVDDVAPDLGWMTQRSSWIGYVAVCEDKREIARMGRRDIVIALRGTATCLEWAENFRSALVPLPGADETAEAQDQAQAQIQPKVGCGFLSLHKTPGAHVPSLAQSVVDEVRRLVSHYEGEALSITITGHSLGAALALLVADELTENIPDSLPPVAVLSFGGPRVGNRGFANRITAKNVKVLRIVNNQDMITRVPGIFMSEGLNQKLKEAGMDEHMLLPWAYSHVGTELRVDTKMSPFLRPDADVACCHDLEAYLHLVDGFSASDCPFRANAKRSLVKLLHEQGSNVKKLYTSKAKALKLDIEKDVRRPIYGCLPSPS